MTRQTLLRRVRREERWPDAPVRYRLIVARDLTNGEYGIHWLAEHVGTTGWSALAHWDVSSPYSLASDEALARYPICKRCWKSAP